MSTVHQPKLQEGVAVAITGAELREGHTLHLTFDDGFERDIDFGSFLQSSSNPQIRLYLDPVRFRQFRVLDGDLVWGDYELCFPIADLYEGKL